MVLDKILWGCRCSSVLFRWTENVAYYSGYFHPLFFHVCRRQRCLTGRCGRGGEHGVEDREGVPLVKVIFLWKAGQRIYLASEWVRVAAAAAATTCPRCTPCGVAAAAGCRLISGALFTCP